MDEIKPQIIDLYMEGELKRIAAIYWKKTTRLKCRPSVEIQNEMQEDKEIFHVLHKEGKKWRKEKKEKKVEK